MATERKILEILREAGFDPIEDRGIVVKYAPENLSALTAGIRREVSLRLPYDEIRRVTVSEDLLNYRIAIETGEGAVTLTAQQKELSDLRTAGMLSFYSEGLLSASSWHRENLDATLQALQALGA